MGQYSYSTVIKDLMRYDYLKVVGWGAEKASNLAFHPSLILPRMDYYRLSAMAQSGDGCKSRKHIEAILKSLHPSIENTSKPLFQSHEDRERKMFFSKEPLKSHFEDSTNIQSLLNCKCTDCRKARDHDDKLPSLGDSVDLSKKPRFLALMTYLGKVHYIHYWMRRGIVKREIDHLPACPNDGCLKDLMNNSSERETFRSAYERALNMLCPHVFEIPPTMICPYSDFNYPNFEDLRFPYQNEMLNKTQGFFGVMTRLEIHPDYLDSSVLNRMEGYPRIDRNQPPLFALKSVKITAGIPVAKMERDVLSMTSRISGPVSNNFITVIACYQWKQCMHFLFPFVELDLNDLLRYGQCPPGKTAKLTLDESLPDHWLWEQIQGVSRALSAFHTGMENPFTDVKGRVIALHFDLKPANILVTANGTLKITDFGQSIMQVVKADGQITTPYNPGHPRYEPPESLQVAEELGQVSRRGVKDIEVLLNYDVWSLACIMIEVLIHLLDTQTLDDFDKKLETEPVGRFWTGNVLKPGVMDSFEHFRQSLIHDTDQSQYMEDVIQLLQNMLVHDKHKRVHSQEVVQGLEKAKTNFGELQQGTDPKFRELGWNNGKSFSEKEGITLNVIEQKDGRPFYPDVLEPAPCRIRLFSKPFTRAEPPTSSERPAQIGFIWGLQRNREVVVSEQIISEPSEWCFAPTYLFHNHTNGNTRFECRLFPRKFDLAFIFEFASADVNNGQKKFKTPSPREVQISRRHDSYLAMQPQVHPSWKIDNGGGTQIAHEVPSVPIEIDEDKLHKQDGIKTFDIDRMEIILGNHRDFNRFKRGTTNEWC
ncbi:hypothetical protein KAF25_002048 [Fusarium avenaceum]|uniref:Protein kinase domain-containing protein n=1 Tax=Fusarium avenaceum TaxID=40199 RepID=A0A9P7KRQ7_9HYPO|nr:hypothetical protein KAF25_002048 [Fusarium avenaceum]